MDAFSVGLMAALLLYCQWLDAKKADLIIQKQREIIQHLRYPSLFPMPAEYQT